MTELIDTKEMYLRTILECEEEGVPALRARIAERLGHSGPTVSQTVARMERDGLLTVREDRSIDLSQEGRRRAVRVMRKHRLTERLLAEVIGLEQEYVHDEACRWEHVMSDRVERKVLGLLDAQGVSPYPHHIPGLAELREGAAETELATPAIPLTELRVKPRSRGAGGTPVVVDRLGEPTKRDTQMLALLSAAGVRPGERVRVARIEGQWMVGGGDGESSPRVVVDDGVAAHLYVRPVV